MNFRKKRKIISCLLFAGSVLQGVGLYLSDSRAGWVGLFVGLVCGLFLIFKHKDTKDTKENVKKRCVLRLFVFKIFLVVLFFAVGITFLYNYRPKSADARLLIWRVSCDMIADRPLFGHGAGAFDGKYMLYQAAFFEQHPQSPFALVAGNAGYPFNELLNALICFGIIGVVLLLLLLWSAFRQKTPLFQAGLSAWLAFSMFSYPAEVFPLLLLGVACLGGIESEMKINRNERNGFTRWAQRVNSDKIKGGVRCVFIAFIAFSLCRIWLDTIELKRLSRELTGQYLDMDEVERSFRRMRFNSTFNNCYMPWIESLPAELCAVRSKEVFPSCESYCLRGRAFLNVGETDQAEQAFYTASNMVPTLIRPKYALWKLYMEKGDTAAAKKMAETILNCPLKTESIYTLKVKKEMRVMLE